MNTKRKIYSIPVALLITLLLAFSLASCSGKDSGTQSPSGNESQNSAPQTSETEAQYIFPPVTGLTSDDTLGSEHEEITQELISMVNHNDSLKSMLIKSIEKAKEINPDKKTNPAQTLEEYYDYVDWAAKALPWSILPGVEDNFPALYDQIDQSLNYFYFINDQPLEELKDKGLYNNSIQYMEPYRTWLINFTAQWGQYLNTTDSWSEEYYQTALANEDFNLHNDTYESADNWKTFNQFFARYLKSPDVRPVTAPDDGSVVVSPADSQPQGVWKIDENSNIVHEEGVNIKSGIFTSADALLGDSDYLGAFAGGTLTHTFLDVNDYHRYHFPVSGTIKEVKIIPGDDAIGGAVTWDKDRKKYILSAKTPDWQMIETRGSVIIETEEYGLVAVLPVAMSQVSSVNFEDAVKVGAKVEKGDMLGCFLFGGSDIIMLFQKDANFEMTVPTGEDGKLQHIDMGTQYGIMKK